MLLDSISNTLKGLAHAIAPASSAAFDTLAWVSLAFYLVFAVVALHYALKPWAGKMLLVSIGGGMFTALVLHLSLLRTPAYVGEVPLWKFVFLSQYLPWAGFSVGCAYLLYRACSQLFKGRS